MFHPKGTFSQVLCLLGGVVVQPNSERLPRVSRRGFCRHSLLAMPWTQGLVGGWEAGARTVLVLPLFFFAWRQNELTMMRYGVVTKQFAGLFCLEGQMNHPLFWVCPVAGVLFGKGHHYLDNLGMACLPLRRSPAEPGLSRGSRLSLRPFRYGHQSCTTNARTTNPRMLIDIYVKRGQCERERTLTQRLQDPKHSFDLAQMSGMPFPKTNAEHRHVRKKRSSEGSRGRPFFMGDPIKVCVRVRPLSASAHT